MSLPSPEQSDRIVSSFFVRAAHGAQRSKRLPPQLILPRCVRGLDYR
jgi:hypothetical protein